MSFYTLADFKPGDRIELHPATDLWMRGARYANVLSVGRTKLHLHLDTGQVITLDPALVQRFV